MEITINRQSVYMGDDSESHRICFHVKEDLMYEESFEALKQKHYLPNVSDNNVV